MAKTALVTGSTSGIGLGIAEALCAAGYDVMLHGSRPARDAEELRSRLSNAHGTRVAYHAADVSRAGTVAGLVAAAESELGPIDVLVNNAGIQHVAPIEDFPDDKWNAILAVNLTAAFHAIKLVVPGMKQRKWGRIINVASAHALVASPFKAAYVTAKHGLLGLTKTVALEVAEHGVTCNAICPGYVLTPLVQKQIPDTARSRGISEDAVVRDVMLAPQATKQFVTVEQLGGLAVFLTTDAASQITGAALPVDGGWTAH
jgi:3-hydroxybutyrate dehydrogenase